MGPKRTSASASGKKRQKKVMNIEQKVRLLDELNGGMSFAAVGRMFGINESTARYIHKNEKAIRAAFAACAPLTTKAISQVREKAIIKMENALYIWLESQKRKRVPVDSNAIREKARVLYGLLKQSEPCTSSRSTFTASKGWLDHFKRRFSLRKAEMSEAASAYQFTASSYPEELKQLIEEKGFCSEQIFNAAESALFWKKMPNRAFTSKEQHHKASKDRLTLLFCCNAAGHVMKPGLIYKAANPRSINHCDKKYLPVHWMHNKKTWATKDLFLDWFHSCFIPETKQYLNALGLEFKVLLILDSVTGHPTNLQLESDDVDVAFLPSNTSSHIQPLDQGVIRTFKACYIRRSMARLVAAMEEDNHLKLTDYLKKFSIADCLCLIMESVIDLKEETVNACWCNLWPDCVKTKTTFLPVDEEADAVKMTVELAHQVDDSGFQELQELDVTELIDSHTSELKDEELLEMIASADEEEDAGEEGTPDETQKLNLERLAEILQILKRAAEKAFETDSHMVRAINFKRDLEIAAEPYQRLLEEMKKGRNNHQ
ncbi:Tigger transposable element-derived protein 1 [Trichinella pseudospiralis]|uniref:Tigger transposable element-derived protein 1 n=2 Tax=Trichinella pseudospiralis TaxID=6337 RepID=A0A0V1KCS1_TRIPS|nr:Tigger transposable element-derived protein 1 [Trichinella pseudospiralis]KRY78304.1 Tigger transposable element-derived protein 1 [Trichinella pseudospiralis]KRY91584.1 Tigger transposable element-derived protein 1 [Trichinella pseudospiralis]KRZ34167.1 Tigger transposable element-derived protein 1 [Trichinella pseudospiralis]KRZ45059.1 Tigger transposable element-derived protein 1 [Trichinella pseudospiralis]